MSPLFFAVARFLVVALGCAAYVATPEPTDALLFSILVMLTLNVDDGGTLPPSGKVDVA